MRPTIGRIVLYVLTPFEVERIERRRTNGRSIAARLSMEPPQWPVGAQAHIGNPTYAGDVLPMIVVRVWPNEAGDGRDGVNGQVLLDGNDSFWVTSVLEGTEPGSWHWPSRV